MISIVIPAYNEETTIRPLLESVARLAVRESYEVLLVDNNSHDATVAIAETYLDRLPLRILHEPRKGRGAARATGFAAARGEIIFSTDTDVVLSPDWIAKIVPAFDNPSVVAVTGTCKINDCAAYINIIFNTMQPATMVLHRIFFGAFWLTGSNFAIRKSIYERAGGFNSRLNSQEDTQLGRQVQQLGKIKWVYNAPVLTSGRRFRRGLLRGTMDYAVSFTERHLLKRSDSILSDER